MTKSRLIVNTVSSLPVTLASMTADNLLNHYSVHYHPTLAQANVRFQITSLSGSLLLPDTPLRLTPSVAVRVPPAEYNRVVQASEAEGTVRESAVSGFAARG